jgi:hypothetical protein
MNATKGFRFPSIILQEARNIEDFYENFKVSSTVKIPLVYKKLSGQRVLVMEWIDGIRCTDPQVFISATELHKCLFSYLSLVSTSILDLETLFALEFGKSLAY